MQVSKEVLSSHASFSSGIGSSDITAIQSSAAFVRSDSPPQQQPPAHPTPQLYNRHISHLQPRSTRVVQHARYSATARIATGATANVKEANVKEANETAATTTTNNNNNNTSNPYSSHNNNNNNNNNTEARASNNYNTSSTSRSNSGSNPSSSKTATTTTTTAAESSSNTSLPTSSSSSAAAAAAANFEANLSAPFIHDEELANEVLSKAGPANTYMRVGHSHDIGNVTAETLGKASGLAAKGGILSNSNSKNNSNDNSSNKYYRDLTASALNEHKLQMGGNGGGGGGTYANYESDCANIIKIEDDPCSVESSVTNSINQDPDPIHIMKPNTQNVVYKQQVNIRYLQPPTPPPPAPIIIREKQLPTPAAQPPIIIRQTAPAPPTPVPLIIRGNSDEFFYF
jgi:hypothetical protein